MKEKIVLAYSGGLDTSVAIKWLQEQYQYDVIAVCVDVGEGKDLEFVKNKAIQVGACASYVVPAQEEFAKDYILPALQANALYEGIYPLVSALSRPLIAKILVEIAKKENAVAIAHGCTGKGNDQVRFDVSIMALAPSVKIVAPARLKPTSREDAIEYAKQHNIPLPIDLNNPFSIDQNLWGRSCECGVLENPWVEPPEAAYEWTQSITNAPDKAEIITIDFVQGVPTKLNQQASSLPELIAKLNAIAGKHGMGRIDHVENRLVGIKSREVYEAPAAMTLITAHRALEAITLPREVAHFKPVIEQRFANLIYEGLWFSPLKDALLAFIQQTQKTVTGTVRIKLHKGNAIVIGRTSPHSLYNFELATYQAQDQFDHQAGVGFIKLWGLPTQVYHVANQTQQMPQSEQLVDVG